MEIETSATHLDSLRSSEKDSSSMWIEPSQEGNTIHIAAADIRLRGASKLDLGNAHVSSLKLSVEDDALINLSGFSINKLVH